MRTGEPDLYESARNARCPDHWAFEPHMERLPRSSAGAPRHRRTQYPPIETQPSVQPGDPVTKEAEVRNENPQVVENIGGREGIRTPGLLVANDENKFIRRGAATTYVS